MTGHDGMHRQIALLLLIGLLIVVAPAWARRQESLQPAPGPSTQQPTNTEDGKDKEKQGETVGKSKPEKEPRTIKDCMSDVLPTYGTRENARELPPHATGPKASTQTP